MLGLTFPLEPTNLASSNGTQAELLQAAVGAQSPRRQRWLQTATLAVWTAVQAGSGLIVVPPSEQ